MSVSAILDAAGGVASGLGSLIGSIGQGRRIKKQIQWQERSQKSLMDYQNEIQHRNTLEERQYNEDLAARNFEQYESLSARRADAEKAGFNPEAVLGSSGGSGAVPAGTTGGISIPGAPDVDRPDPGAQLRSTGEILKGIASFKEIKSRAQQLDNERNAERLDNEARTLDLEGKMYDNLIKRNTFNRLSFHNSREDWMFNRDKQAFRMQMERDSEELEEYKLERLRNNKRFMIDVQDAEDRQKFAVLQRRFIKGQITEKNWMNAYRKQFGRNPSSNWTFADFLEKLFLTPEGPLSGSKSPIVKGLINSVPGGYSLARLYDFITE